MLPDHAQASTAKQEVTSKLKDKARLHYQQGLAYDKKGQYEAAHSVSLNYVDTMRFVILPQAIRIVIPPLTNNCINVMKDTALASVVAMPDLLKQATQAQALSANPTPLIGAALIYLILLWPMVVVVARLEKRYSKGKR